LTIVFRVPLEYPGGTMRPHLFAVILLLSACAAPIVPPPKIFGTLTTYYAGDTIPNGEFAVGGLPEELHTIEFRTLANAISTNLTRFGLVDAMTSSGTNFQMTLFVSRDSGARSIKLLDNSTVSGFYARCSLELNLNSDIFAGIDQPLWKANLIAYSKLPFSSDHASLFLIGECFKDFPGPSVATRNVAIPQPFSP
jgi:hypothetical protein